MKASYAYNKIDGNEIIALCKFAPKHFTNPLMEHISEGASSWKTNPYQYHMMFSLKDLKPQKSDTDHWSIHRDCLSYTILSLHQCHEMIITTPENKYEHKVYKQSQLLCPALYLSLSPNL